jgi:hypothetical protein
MPPIDFITPTEEYGLPSGPTTVISGRERPFISSRVMFVGIVGDSNNVIKTVTADVANAVTIEDVSVEGAGIRWFRLSRPRGRRFKVQAKDAKGSVVTSFEASVIELPRASGPAEFELEPHDPKNSGRINLRVYAPNNDANYIDRKMTYVGYHIWLFGFQVLCDGMKTPIYVPDSLVDLNLTRAEPIDATVYDTLEQANQAVRRAAAKANGVTPFAYYRGAGGAAIAPTIFSPATTPRIIATYYEARALYAAYVQEALIGIAIGVAGGTVLRVILGRILRATPGERKPPRGGPAYAEPPPVVARLRDTSLDLQNKNPVRTVEVLSAPRTYRHTLTADIPPVSYARIEMEGSMRFSTGAKAHYGEGVYAWPAGQKGVGTYIDIEVRAGTGVETINVGGQRWVRMLPPEGNTLPVRIVGTNVPKADIEFGRRMVRPDPPKPKKPQ